MYRKPLVEDQFEVPNLVEYEQYQFLPLTIDHVELDHAAVLDNTNESGSPQFPKPTKKQNLIDLGYHQKEFQKRASFTYTILTPSKDECIGCIYIYPAETDEYDVEVDMWVRKKYEDLEKQINKDILEWINEKWPFQNPKILL